MKSTFSPEDQTIINLLDDLGSHKVEYPPELFTRRRVAFIKHVAQLKGVKVRNTPSLQRKEVIRLLENLTLVDVEYPPELLAKRRSAFTRQALDRRPVSLWETIRSTILSRLNYITRVSRTPMMEVMRTSFVIGSIIMATYLGFLMNGNREDLAVAFNVSPTRMNNSIPLPITATAVPEFAGTICKPGYAPPLCLAKRIENNQALSYQGNGVARAAVAKDTIQELGGFHQPSYVNDGLLGSGASWVSKTAYSWIKIDLGKPMPINTISFGKDRLGNINGRDPGQFTVAVASHDNVYANGDSSNDANEYRQVYNSSESDFSGEVSGSETVEAIFEPVLARYVKITVTNPGTAIDEVEVFFFNEVPPPNDNSGMTETPNSRPTRTSTSTNTPTPTNTPTRTPTSTPTPTYTPTPTSTSTPTATNTSTPTSTNTPTPTNTSTPTSTNTPVPTNTPLPTNTPTPIPTNTPVPTDTPLPTNTPIPTDTPITLPTP